MFSWISDTLSFAKCLREVLNSLARKAGEPEIFDLIRTLAFLVAGSYSVGCIFVKCTREFMRVQRAN